MCQFVEKWRIVHFSDRLQGWFQRLHDMLDKDGHQCRYALGQQACLHRPFISVVPVNLVQSVCATDFHCQFHLSGFGVTLVWEKRGVPPSSCQEPPATGFLLWRNASRLISSARSVFKTKPNSTDSLPFSRWPIQRRLTSAFSANWVCDHPRCFRWSRTSSPIMPTVLILMDKWISPHTLECNIEFAYVRRH